MMADTMDGLFGPTPEQVRAAQMQATQQQGQQYGKLDPFEQANAGMFTSGARIADLIARATGGVNVAQQQATQQQEAMQGADLQTPDGLRAVAKKMLDMGNQKSAYLLAQKAAELEKEQKASNLAQQKQDENEQFRRDQMVQAAELKKMQLTQAAQYQQSIIDSRNASTEQKAQAEKDRNALLLMMKQMDVNARLAVAGMKGDTTAGKAEEKAAKAQEGKEGLEGDITQARTIIADLDKSGGITSTQRGSLANTLTSLSTSGVGQAFGRVVGSEDQSKRDQLKSLRLQLLNSIKQVTGMGSAQLNSNVELKTWLESLGSDGMSKEANEAILQNIENKYLKGAAKPPVPTPPPGKPAAAKRYKFDAQGNMVSQ